MLAASFVNAVRLKGSLLVEGCTTGKAFSLPSQSQQKTTHLYAHSTHASTQPLPEDLYVVGQPMGIRFRYCPTSRWVLNGNRDQGFWVEAAGEQPMPVTLGARPSFGDEQVAGGSLSAVVSRLGADVLGLAPSNSCFYFPRKVACKFCEILPNYQHGVTYPKARKPLNVQVAGVKAALAADPSLRHVAVTSGNVISYDETVRMFCSIGQEAFADAPQLEQTLATLMPPDDFSLIDALQQAGFTRVYFPLEVFDPPRFSAICPGKAQYGYTRILAALTYALRKFGAGNVFTNFVYGIQSYVPGAPFAAQQENRMALQATRNLLSLGVIPAFTVYHYSGHNSIGAVSLDATAVSDFFIEWGELVHQAKLLPGDAQAALFGPVSLTNTMFNDGYNLARVNALPPTQQCQVAL